MGTRCLTVFHDVIHDHDVHHDKEIAVLYRQMDGYLDGHGKELCEFLKGYHIVNGIPFGVTGRIFNGMSCLAASVVAYFKHGVGQFYLYPAGIRDCGEEFIYEIFGTADENDGEIRLKISTCYGDKYTFEGTPAEALAWIATKPLDDE